MAAAISRGLAKAPLNLLLAFIGLLWLVPTLGLFLDSLLAPDQIGTTGWWKIFTEPSLATFENYGNVLDNDSITGALGTTLIVAIFGTAIPIFIGALAAYAFAWIEFPGRDWLFLGVVALLVVPLQMALIPMFSLYNNLGLFDTALALILFHSAFGLPFAIFLLRNFFVGHPEGHPGVGTHRRCLGADHLPAADPPARPAGDCLARHLPVPLDLERLPRGAHLRTRHPGDHRRDLLRVPPVRSEPRADRTRRLHFARRPTGPLLRLPALLRGGPARGLRQVRQPSAASTRWRTQHAGSRYSPTSRSRSISIGTSAPGTT